MLHGVEFEFAAVMKHCVAVLTGELLTATQGGSVTKNTQQLWVPELWIVNVHLVFLGKTLRGKLFSAMTVKHYCRPQ